MSDYNGWTNYATWRVNLEIFDGLDPREMGWTRKTYDLGPILKEYANDVLFDGMKPSLALDYAMSFVSEVNWYEIAEHMMDAYYDEEQETEEV